MKNSLNYTGDGVGLHQDESLVYVKSIPEKILFNLLDLILKGKELFEDQNIKIEKSMIDDEISFRVYMEKMCFDSYKLDQWKHLEGIVSTYHYFNGWAGFDKIPVEEVLDKIKKLNLLQVKSSGLIK